MQNDGILIPVYPGCCGTWTLNECCFVVVHTVCLNRSEFNVVDPVVQGSDMPTNVPRFQGRTFAGTQEQFWPDALSAATSDS